MTNEEKDLGADAAVVDSARSAEAADAAPHAAPTPGPWTLDPVDPSLVMCDNETIVADCGFSALLSDTQCQVNAHLIAAAPELLQALKLAIEPGTDAVRGPRRLVIEAAIAKAEGR